MAKEEMKIIQTKKDGKMERKIPYEITDEFDNTVVLYRKEVLELDHVDMLIEELDRNIELTQKELATLKDKRKDYLSVKKDFLNGEENGTDHIAIKE